MFAGASILFLVQCSPVSPSLSKTSIAESGKNDTVITERSELARTQLLFRLPIKSSSRSGQELLDASAKKLSFSLTEDQLDHFKKEASVELTLPEDAIPASVQQALLKLDLGKSEMPVDEVLALDLELKSSGDVWTLRISGKVSADLSKRLREKLVGASVIYITDDSR